MRCLHIHRLNSYTAASSPTTCDVGIEGPAQTAQPYDTWSAVDQGMLRYAGSMNRYLTNQNPHRIDTNFGLQHATVSALYRYHAQLDGSWETCEFGATAANEFDRAGIVSFLNSGTLATQGTGESHGIAGVFNQSPIGPDANFMQCNQRVQADGAIKYGLDSSDVLDPGIGTNSRYAVSRNNGKGGSHTAGTPMQFTDPASEAFSYDAPWTLILVAQLDAQGTYLSSGGYLNLVGTSNNQWDLAGLDHYTSCTSHIGSPVVIVAHIAGRGDTASGNRTDVQRLTRIWVNNQLVAVDPENSNRTLSKNLYAGAGSNSIASCNPAEFWAFEGLPSDVAMRSLLDDIYNHYGITPTYPTNDWSGQVGYGNEVAWIFPTRDMDNAPHTGLTTPNFGSVGGDVTLSEAAQLLENTPGNGSFNSKRYMRTTSDDATWATDLNGADFNATSHTLMGFVLTHGVAGRINLRMGIDGMFAFTIEADDHANAGQLRYYDADTATNHWSNAGSVTYGTMQHVAVRRNKNVLDFFVNGVNVGNDDTLPDALASTANDFDFAYYPNSSMYTGGIDDFRVYNEALTDRLIAMHARSTSTGYNLLDLSAQIGLTTASAINNAGNRLYFSEQITHKIKMVDLETGKVSTVSTEPSAQVNQMGFDSTDTYLYYVEAGNTSVRRLNISTSVTDSSWATLSHNPDIGDMHYDPVNDYLLIAATYVNRVSVVDGSRTIASWEGALVFGCFNRPGTNEHHLIQSNTQRSTDGDPTNFANYMTIATDNNYKQCYDSSGTYFYYKTRNTGLGAASNQQIVRNDYTDGSDVVLVSGVSSTPGVVSVFLAVGLLDISPDDQWLYVALSAGIVKLHTSLVNARMWEPHANFASLPTYDATYPINLAPNIEDGLIYENSGSGWAPSTNAYTVAGSHVDGDVDSI